MLLLMSSWSLLLLLFLPLSPPLFKGVYRIYPRTWRHKRDKPAATFFFGWCFCAPLSARDLAKRFGTLVVARNHWLARLDCSDSIGAASLHAANLVAATIAMFGGHCCWHALE